MRPLLWMRLIRDARPGAVRGYVLVCLAQRMSADGSGYASSRQLAEDAGVTTRTVERATRWARDGSYLLRTRRGCRRGDGRVLASEWQLCAPRCLPDTRDGKTESLPDTRDGKTESLPDTDESLPDSGPFSTRHQRPPISSSSLGLSTSVRALADGWALDGDDGGGRRIGFDDSKIKSKTHPYEPDEWDMACAVCELPAAHPIHREAA